MATTQERATLRFLKAFEKHHHNKMDVLQPLGSAANTPARPKGGKKRLAETPAPLKPPAPHLRKQSCSPPPPSASLREAKTPCKVDAHVQKEWRKAREAAEKHGSNGRRAWSLRHCEQAIASFTRAISEISRFEHQWEDDMSMEEIAASMPDYFMHKYYTNRARVHIEVGNVDLAVRDCNQALLRVPTWVKAYQLKGAALLLLSKVDEARETFEHGLTVAPDDVKLKEGCNKAARWKFEQADDDE